MVKRTRYVKRSLRRWACWIFQGGKIKVIYLKCVKIKEEAQGKALKGSCDRLQSEIVGECKGMLTKLERIISLQIKL